jgi:hypothetical protein
MNDFFYGIRHSSPVKRSKNRIKNHSLKKFLTVMYCYVGKMGVCVAAVIHGFSGRSIIQPNERKGTTSTFLPNVAHSI